MVGSWAWADARLPAHARLEERHQALLEDPPPRLPWPRANIVGLLAGLAALPLGLDARLDEPARDRVVVAATVMVAWFAVWALANVTVFTPLADWVDERREARQIRRASLSGEEQLERVVQLSRARPLNARGLEWTGRRLVTLAQRHPRIPPAQWEAAWLRTLNGAIADWDHLGLELLAPALEEFLSRQGAPLGPADGLRLLERVARLAPFPPGGDLPTVQAVDRLRQFDRLMARVAQLGAEASDLRTQARQRWVAIRTEAAFAQDLPEPPAPVIGRGRARAAPPRREASAQARGAQAREPLAPGPQAAAPTR